MFRAKSLRNVFESAGSLIVRNLEKQVVEFLEQGIEIADRSDALANQNHRQEWETLADAKDRVVIHYLLRPMRAVIIQKQRHPMLIKLCEQLVDIPIGQQKTMARWKHSHGPY